MLLLLLAWILAAPFFARFLIAEKPLERADAIFVLGGSAAYIERNQAAAQLYKQGIAPKILVSDDGTQGGWNKLERRNPYFAEKARWELIGQGVPAEVIEILAPTVEGTHEEADLLIETAPEKHLNSVLLVTSAYHTRRTLRTFERAAAKNNLPLEIGIEFPPEQQIPPAFSWWTSRKGWSAVGGEYVKLVYYWLFY